MTATFNRTETFREAAAELFDVTNEFPGRRSWVVDDTTLRQLATVFAYAQSLNENLADPPQEADPVADPYVAESLEWTLNTLEVLALLVLGRND